MRKGVVIENETEGAGKEVKRGDTVTISYSLFLNRGDLIQQQECSFTLGQRREIAGLEYGIEGMRVGGRRRFRVGPHLAYRDAGVHGLVPPNAVLTFDVELLDVQREV